VKKFLTLIALVLFLLFLTSSLVLSLKNREYLRSLIVSFGNKKQDVKIVKPFQGPTDVPVPSPVSKTMPPTVYVVTTTTVLPLIEESNQDWGVAKQLGDHTWTLQVGMDDRMATPKEIMDALNYYRQKKGASALAWDDNLGKFAQLRADYFNQTGKLDEHKGFSDYVNNGDNLKQLNFYHLGENSSLGYQLIGVHLIEWVFAADPAHDGNQLNSSWTHVGVGASGTSVDLIFGE
jgi:uncharacterized protein YkwD